MKYYKNFERTLGSLKFAVMIILVFCAFLTWGTLMESKHGADYANRLVYKSWPFLIVQFSIFLSILFAALIRLPPKKHLYGFYTIHAGLITLFIGAWVTYSSGIDGAIKLHPNTPTQSLEVNEDELRIGDIHYALPFISGVTQIDQELAGAILGKYYPFASERLRWISDTSELQPTSQYLISNDKIREEFTLSLHPSSTFGQKEKLGKLNIFYLNPVYESCFQKRQSGILVWNKRTNRCQHVRKVSLHERPFSLGEFEKTPHLFLFGKTMAYFDQRNKNWRISVIAEKSKLPWMNLNLTLLRHETGAFPQIVPEYQKPKLGMVEEELNVRALEVNFMGKNFWVTSRKPVIFNTGNKLITFELGKKKLELPYTLNLDKFLMGTDPGSDSAASYESQITLFQNAVSKKHRIFMNNPLKFRDFTFYQASFFPISPGVFGSVLSVNFDPGRWLKYLGAILLVLGSIWHYQLRRLKGAIRA